MGRGGTEDSAVPGLCHGRDGAAVLGEVGWQGAGLTLVWGSYMETLRPPRGAVQGLAVGCPGLGFKASQCSDDAPSCLLIPIPGGVTPSLSSVPDTFLWTALCWGALSQASVDATRMTPCHPSTGTSDGWSFPRKKPGDAGSHTRLDAKGTKTRHLA